MQIVASTPRPQKDGVVGLRWYDRRENPDNLSFYARFAASRGGAFHPVWVDERNGVPQVYTARVSVTR